MDYLKNTGSATKWVAIGLLVKQGMRLASNLIMTRILSPEIFGLMAIVNLVIHALEMLSDIGIRPSLIRSSRSDIEFLRTAWTLKLIRGLVLWLTTFLIAWPLSVFYEQPQLLYLLPCTGLIALLVGASSIEVIQYQKYLKYKKLVILEAGSAFLGLSAMIIIGLLYSSIWALVVGGVLSTLFMTLFSFMFIDGIKHAFRWDKEVVKEMLHFGKWIFISTALTFFVSQYDRLALGKLSDMTSLGLYSIALIWAQLPVMIIGTFNDRIFYPIISEYSRRGELGEIVDIRNAIVKLSAVTCIFMLAVSHITIDILYSDEYIGAGDILLILVVLGWFQVIEGINTYLLLTLGRPKDKIPGQLVGLLLLASLIGFSYANFGIKGVAWLAVISMLIRVLILDLQLRKDKMALLLFDLKMTAQVVIFGFGFHWVIENQLHGVANWIVFILSVCVAAITAAYLFFNHTELKRLFIAKQEIS